MPGSSFDSLVRLPPRRRRRHKGYTRVTRKNYRPPLSPIQETDLYKMLAQPSVKTLETRLKECYHRLNKQKMAVTTVHHRSPRGSKSRSRRRSTRSKRRRRSTRSKRRRRSTRSKRPRRSSRRSKRSDPVARARARARAAQRDREQKRVQQLLNRNW